MSKNEVRGEAQDVSALTRLRAVLDDLERVGWAEKCLGLEIWNFTSDREGVQRVRRARLEARSRFAQAVEAHPELTIDRDLGPESITALEAVDPEAAAAWDRAEFKNGNWNQAVFVTGPETVRLYVNGCYAYTFKEGSSLLVGYDGPRRRWEVRDWFLWPLEDVVDIASGVLEEYPELAEAWERVSAGTTEEERDV